VTSEQVRAAVMARRIAINLVLRFAVPGRPDSFVCYPRDDAQKQRFIAEAARKGWVLVP
jgi:hypothetical protein